MFAKIRGVSLYFDYRWHPEQRGDAETEHIGEHVEVTGAYPSDGDCMIDVLALLSDDDVSDIERKIVEARDEADAERMLAHASALREDQDERAGHG